ncbi:damage-inducible protein DinB [Chitinophaga silvatica]|uniref:Damage-inducible protein DinB n=1 Tax=Chitinophaga silvatica TaxID=2282649 RepID=A0A3E1Y920_9BACT|nr:DinB family protein [Chitinophaga silvatica]RFS21949.1 damage-inducible protein DinB [Chitinophaga silvatica]
MENNVLTANATGQKSFMNPKEFLAHWQGHRKLTRRIIDAFPEDKLFEFRIGGMRPFAEMAREFIGMATPSLYGMVTGEWKPLEAILPAGVNGQPTTKADLLALWDAVTPEIDELYSQIPEADFHKTISLFNKYEGQIHSLLLYIADNEIHHRGQGYVYLRALNIEPPFFFDR